MKNSILCAVLGAALLVGAPFANAAGCVKGAAVGGVAGHVAGHHGLLGAAAGCLIGKHRAHKQAKLSKQELSTQHASR